MKIKLLIVVASLTTLMACTTTKTTQDGAIGSVAKAQGYRCKKSVKLGSHIGSKRCTTKKQRVAEKAKINDIMGPGQRTGPHNNKDQ